MEQESASPYVPRGKEFFLGFVLILMLFYVNYFVVRMLCILYLVYVVGREAVGRCRRLVPRDPVLRGFGLFALALFVSALCSLEPGLSVREIEFLAAGVGLVVLYHETAARGVKAGRPLLLWGEIGGAWLVVVLIVSFFLKWGKGSVRMSPFFPGTATTPGYVGLLVASFAVAHLLADRMGREKWKPGRGTWIFLFGFAVVLAWRLGYYLQKKGYVDDRLVTAGMLAFLFWVLSAAWLAAGSFRSLFRVGLVGACGWLCYLSKARGAYFPYVLIILLGGNVYFLLDGFKKGFLRAAGYTCLVSGIFLYTLPSFVNDPRLEKPDRWQLARAQAPGKGAVRKEEEKKTRKEEKKPAEPREGKKPPVPEKKPVVKEEVVRALHLTGREELYVAAWRMWKKSPRTMLVGIGFNTLVFKEMSPAVYQELYREIYAGKNVKIPDRHSSNAHNLFLHVLVVSGLLGFGALVVFVFAVMHRLADNLLRGAIVDSTAAIPLVAVMLYGLTHYPLVHYPTLSAFLCMGVAAVRFGSDD